MLYVKVSKKCIAEVVSLPRRTILCRRHDQNAADVSKIFRRRVQGFRRRVQRFHRRRGNAADATSYLLYDDAC